MKTKEIKKLFEADPTHFSSNLKKVFGVQESVTKRSIDPQAAKDLDNISPRKMARDWLGEDYYDSLMNYCQDNPYPFKRSHGYEAEGGPVTASLMTPINLWTAGVLGLYDAKVLEGYNLPEFAFRQLSTETSTIIPGGHKHIRAGYDGTKPVKALQEREAAPMVGAAPAYIWTQSCETHQIQCSLTMEAMLSDITGVLQSTAVTVGKATAFNENDRFFDVFWGRTNTYCYNSPDTVGNIPNADTYQFASGTTMGGYSATGSAPFNYVNGVAALPLVDHLTLNTGWLTLNQNYDPVTGWRFTPGKNLKLVVGPDLLVQAKKIKNQISAFQRLGYVPTSSGTVVAEQYREEATGPATQFLDFNFEVVDATYLGIDRLCGGNVTTPVVGNHNATTGGTMAAITLANAKNTWALGSPEGIQYQVLRPLMTNTYPLTGDEMAQRIVFRGDAMVMSRFVVIDPRHWFLGLPVA